MAPSRDRLLHFGFKATVSDRGRGWVAGEGHVPTRSYWEATRLKGLGGQTNSSSAWWVGACCLSRRGEVGARVLCAVVLLSSLTGRRARAHSPYSPSHRQIHRHIGTSLPLLLAVGLSALEARAGSRRRHRRRAPVALGLTAAGSARGWGGWPAPRRAPPPPPPHAVRRPGRLCREERRCWQVGSVFVLG